MLNTKARQPEPWPADPVAQAALIARNKSTPETGEQIGRFLADCVVEHGAISGGDLYRSFETYADERAWSPHLRPTVAQFGREMTQRGFARKRTKRGVQYTGIGLA